MARSTNALQPSFERLETRMVPAGLFLNHGVLSINGAIRESNNIVITGGGSLNNPFIHIQGNLGSMNVNRSFNPGVVTKIVFIGGNMDDRFTNNGDLPSKAYGYGGVDRLTGGGATDYFYGGSHTDILSGRGGADYLDGGDGMDSIYGGDGNDWLIGGRDLDFLFGEGDNDILIGGLYNPSTQRYTHDGGRDVMLGGPGADTFLWEWATGSDGSRWNRESVRDFTAGDRYIY